MISAEMQRCKLSDKLCYRTKRLAKLAGFDKQKLYGREYRPYKCQCGKYHLSSVNYFTTYRIRMLAELGLEWFRANRLISI